MIAIKHRITGVTLCEFDVTTIRVAVETGKANLGGANLYGADLYGANLRGANLGGADLGGANLGGANLYGANLRGANLRGANLGGADLGGANLYGADLYGANLRGANLRGANLGGANLGDADLGAKGKLLPHGALSVGPIGSRNDTLTAFHTDKGIFIRAGCFFDTLDAFRSAVENTHGAESYHGKMYLGVANLVEFKFKER